MILARRLSRRPAVALAACALISALLPGGPAGAVGTPPTISLPDTVSASYNGTTHITTIVVTPNDSTSTQVNLAVDHGDLTLASTSGLTFAAGDGTQDPTLTFTGTNANVAAALADVTYRPGAYAGSATLNGQVTDAGSLYFAGTGHFYQFVSSAGISWTAARDAAAAATLYGMAGYLTTVTSSAENGFVQSKLAGEGWMGATDTVAEGEWRWVAGPEGLEDSGSGRVFFRDDTSCGGGSTGFSNGAVNGEYNNWGSGEPNDYPPCPTGEDYAHFRNDAQWNDYPLQLPAIAGYVVEYGGMPGDVSTVSTDSSAITVAAVAPGAPTLTQATPADNKITATWTAPADNGGAAVTGYTVTANPGNHTAAAGGGATSVDVTGLSGGTTYTVTVTATNSAGTSPASNSLDATPTGSVVTTTTTATTAPPTTTAPTTTTAPPADTVPGAPTITAVTPGYEQLGVVWTAPDDGGSPITSYTVTATAETDAAGRRLRVAYKARETEVDGGTTSATVTGLTNGVTYSLTVAATNAVGTGAASAPVDGMPVAPPASYPGDDDSAPDVPPGVDLIGVAPTPDGEGSWGVGSDGGVFTGGNAGFYGSLAGTPLASPIVGIGSTPAGRGYYLVGADGGVFAFGDAVFRGSLAGTPLAASVTGIAATCDGSGYYLSAGDGGVFTFGGARFFGSLAGVALGGPVQGIVPTCSGFGYRLWARDGGVFDFGDARFFGSLGGSGVGDVSGFGVTPSEQGYWLRRDDGTVHHFGDSG